MALPLTYKPRSLRDPEPTFVNDVSFSVRVMESAHFEQGPFPDLITALETVPCTNADTVIVRHDTDGTDSIVYAWNHANSCWYLLDHTDVTV
jgi:hypothetical protein